MLVLEIPKPESLFFRDHCIKPKSRGMLCVRLYLYWLNAAIWTL